MRNHELLENLVASLEKHTSVSVLQEKQEQTVRKQVGTTYKVLPEEKSLSLHLIHFTIFPALYKVLMQLKYSILYTLLFTSIY